MIAYALLCLCAAQVFNLPQVSSYTYQKCATAWVKHGCRVDYHNDLDPLFDDRGPNSTHTIDWDNFNGYVYDLACRCRAAAVARGNTWFALENYGVCLSGSGSYSNYTASHPLDAEERCIGVLKLNASIVSQVDGEICVGGEYRAFFYEITANIGGNPGADAEQEEEEEEEIVKCTAVSDVVLVVDVSGSINNEDFKLMLEFLQKFVNRYDFSAGKSRLGIVSFDHKCYVDLRWMDSSSLTVAGIKKIINELKHKKGSTRTDIALECAYDKVIKLSQRSGVPKTVIVLTDGMSWNGHSLLSTPSKHLRNVGCKIIAIGIGGDVDPSELEIITGSSSQIFLLDSFRSLIDHAAKTLNSLLAKSCIA